MQYRRERVVMGGALASDVQRRRRRKSVCREEPRGEVGWCATAK